MPQLKKDDTKFRQYFGMNLRTFKEILNFVKDDTSKRDFYSKKSISAEERLVITVRYLTSGTCFEQLAEEFLLDSDLICQIVQDTCGLVYKRGAPQYMSRLRSATSLSDAVDIFRLKCQFPNCIGAIDAKQIRIRLLNAAEEFFNESKKSATHIYVQGIVGADGKFMCVDVAPSGLRTNGKFVEKGSASDLLLWMTKNCQEIAVEDSNVCLPYVIVGGVKHPLKHNLLRPFKDSDLDADNAIFNDRAARVLKCAEEAFQKLGAKFPILSEGIDALYPTAENIVKACCVLHNCILDHDEATNYEAWSSSHADHAVDPNSLWASLASSPPGDEEPEEMEELEVSSYCKASTPQAKEARDRFRQYFTQYQQKR